ncbi:MAG: hypothetical protein AB1705_22180 [Verrucomicrobiota bacterium]
MSLLTFNDLRPADTDSLLELQQKQSIAAVARARQTPALLNGGNPLATFNNLSGSNVIETATCVRVDLLADDHQSLPALVLVAKTTNGQGATPTSPGTSQTFVLYYAFSHVAVAVEQAWPVLENRLAFLSCALPDTDASDYTGQRETVSARLPVTGRYLFLWGCTSTLDPDAEINAVIHGVAVE